MGLADRVGNGKTRLVPAWRATGTGADSEGRRRQEPVAKQRLRTQHTGLPVDPPAGGRGRKSATKKGRARRASR